MVDFQIFHLIDCSNDDENDYVNYDVLIVNEVQNRKGIKVDVVSIGIDDVFIDYVGKVILIVNINIIIKDVERLAGMDLQTKIVVEIRDFGV